jgi:hypothetical protein
VKYADGVVPLAMEELALQGMIYNLIEFWKPYEVEMNVEKTKIKRISRRPSSVQNMKYQN